MKFESHERKYEILNSGVIKQIDAIPFKYDAKYVSTYDTEQYQKNEEILMALRYGFVCGSHGCVPPSIMDVGYGNGSFMKFCGKQMTIDLIIGCDVTGVKVEGCEIIEDFRNEYANVICFWDVLEHFEDISFLNTLNCSTLCISLPWCHYSTQGKKWFDEKYKHRKPDEHIRHFNSSSLRITLSQYGWRHTSISNHEDIVRVSAHGKENILSMSFKRK